MAEKERILVADQTGSRLKNSASPYLRSAAHQPVQWFEWGEEAFARARAEDKPILLDIGAVWCHWCHVIDRESYENPEIAALIGNEEVYLCRRLGEDRIRFWHRQDEGFAGRKPIDPRDAGHEPPVQ